MDSGGVQRAAPGSSVKCACGQRIQSCRCGGTECPGWRHAGEWGGHWCGTRPEHGKARPAALLPAKVEDATP
jgi:hypothetical protein